MKDQVYSAVMEDAPGIVKAGTTTSIFFLVNDPGLVQRSGWPASNDFDLVMQGSTESNAEGLTFSQPPGDYLPTATTIEQAGRDPDPPFAPGQGTDQPLNPAPSPAKHASPKKVAKQSEAGKKADPNPRKAQKRVSPRRRSRPPKSCLAGFKVAALPH